MKQHLGPNCRVILHTQRDALKAFRSATPTPKTRGVHDLGEGCKMEAILGSQVCGCKMSVYTKHFLANTPTEQIPVDQIQMGKRRLQKLENQVLGKVTFESFS